MVGYLCYMPLLNAVLNGVSLVLLVVGFVFIRVSPRVFMRAHRFCMLSAFVVSSVFLVSYLAHKFLRYHFQLDLHTSYTGEGFWRYVYYVLLFSHVCLAVVNLPLVFVTLRYAWRGRYQRHKAMARFTYPIWVYVSFTGVLVYFFLYRWQ